MIKVWQRLVPQLMQLPPAERRAALEAARSSQFTPGETILLVAWMLGVFFLVQQILPRAGGDDPAAAALLSNLLITAPLMLAVFGPVHVRRVRRHVASLVSRRTAAGDSGVHGF